MEDIRNVIRVTLLFLGLFGSGALFAGQIEAGTFDTLNTLSTPAFQSVTFSQAFAEAPLVFVLPTNQGGDPANLRIRNVTTTGFEVAVAEPPGNDGPHVAMTNVSYIAAEYGRTEIASGVYLDAGSLSTDTTVQSAVFGSTGGFDTVTYRSDYSSAPSVIAQIQTMNNEANAVPSTFSSPWLVATVDNIGTSTFDISMERGETNDGGTVSLDETVGYLALESATGSFTDSSSNTVLWDALITPDNIVGWDNGFTTESFNQTFSSAPLVVASQATRDGNNGGWVRRGTITSSGIDLIIDEDIYNDPERNHTTERASLVAFSQAFDADLTTDPIDITWEGGGLSGNWTESADWSNQNWDRWNGEDVNLIDGDTLVFNNTGSAITTASVVEDYTAELAGIRFEASTAYTIQAGGGSLIFQDGASIANNSSAAQTLEVPMAARGSDLTINAGSAVGGSFSFTAANTIDLSDTGGVTLTVTGANDTDISAVISGTGGALVKSGTGTLTLDGSASNTYTGTTTVSAGELVLDKSASATAIAGNIQLDGGTLSLNADNQISDSSSIVLNGGAFNTGGNSDTVDTLTLSSNSSIDLGSGSSVLSFADSSGISWVGGSVLSINNWNGNFFIGGGTDQVFFGSTSGGLTSSQVSQIRFVNPNGQAGTYGAFMLSSGEIVPVPEPSTYIIGGLLGALIVLHIFYRKRKNVSSGL